MYEEALMFRVFVSWLVLGASCWVGLSAMLSAVSRGRRLSRVPLAHVCCLCLSPVPLARASLTHASRACASRVCLSLVPLSRVPCVSRVLFVSRVRVCPRCGRILGALFNRVRAELCACTRRPVLSFVAPWVLMRQAVCLYGLTCEKRVFVFVGRSQFVNASTHD